MLIDFKDEFKYPPLAVLELDHIRSQETDLTSSKLHRLCRR